MPTLITSLSIALLFLKKIGNNIKMMTNAIICKLILYTETITIN
jgi:hypothetical protein